MHQESFGILTALATIITRIQITADISQATSFLVVVISGFVKKRLEIDWNDTKLRHTMAVIQSPSVSFFFFSKGNISGMSDGLSLNCCFEMTAH